MKELGWIGACGGGVKPNGMFVTRESFSGEQRFTVREKVSRSAQINLISKFGEHMEAPQL
jgi:hypothetical protein